MKVLAHTDGVTIRVPLGDDRRRVRGSAPIRALIIAIHLFPQVRA